MNLAASATDALRSTVNVSRAPRIALIDFIGSALSRILRPPQTRVLDSVG